MAPSFFSLRSSSLTPSQLANLSLTPTHTCKEAAKISLTPITSYGICANWPLGHPHSGWLWLGIVTCFGPKDNRKPDSSRDMKKHLGFQACLLLLLGALSTPWDQVQAGLLEDERPQGEETQPMQMSRLRSQPWKWGHCRPFSPDQAGPDQICPINIQVHGKE